MTIHCFYHNADLDGKCAGAIVKRAKPGCQLHGVNYGYRIPVPDSPWWRSRPNGDVAPWSLEPGDIVYVVDFSWPMTDMARLVLWLRDQGGELYWIDHHKTAIADYEALQRSCRVQINGLRACGMAGCELAWEFLFGDSIMPRAVHLLGRYDVWDHEDPAVLPFQMGMRQEQWWPDDERWGDLLETDPKAVVEICQQGETILRYATAQRERTAKSYGHEVLLALPSGELVAGVAVNTPDRCSQSLEAIYDRERHAFMSAYMHTPARPQAFSVSLYSDKEGVDVGAFAKQFGGGGHAGAAGFACDELPFLDPPEDPKVVEVRRG